VFSIGIHQATNLKRSRANRCLIYLFKMLKRHP
jgi:hypothetical protein